MLDKHFDFAKRESEIYAGWEAAGCFGLLGPEKGAAHGQPVFDLVMPPPNANGELHIGHCYGYTIMDILGRYHRLQGERVVLIPGKDHAGIQTQVVYEKKLRADGVEVEKMSREDFWQSCYDFCMDRSAYMRGQEKLMGTSSDFTKELFTLDSKVSEVVYDTFEQMYRDGLVYRGSRLVHWSVYSQTAISDVEVEYKEEKGHLWHLKYPLVEKVVAPTRRRQMIDDIGGSLLVNTGNHCVMLLENYQSELKIGDVLVKKELSNEVEIERDWIIFKIEKLHGRQCKPEQLEKFNEKIRGEILQSGNITVVEMVPELDQSDAVVVATTRPETMLGDSAVAVHPADPRYTHLLGKKVRVPECNREIAIIADDRIDIGFGTGAVKITPAHDFLDYQIGQDYGLEQIQVIDKFGLMTEAAGPQYAGLKLLECRAALVENLAANGALLLTEEISHKVPIAERGKDIVEPLISKQWFIAVDKPGLSLKKRALELIESGRIKVYPERLRDQIVQWLRNLTDWNISRQILWGHRMPVWYKNRDSEQEEIKISQQSPGPEWEQETDTFDTWFSSGQWPYSTLIALGLLDPRNVAASEYFPTHTMVMGRDLLFFWSCRMLLLSAYRLNNVPWKNLYFTGLIRDAKGQKMSKSKNNGVEPTAVLAQYGADALRTGMISGSTAGQDVKFDEKKIDAYAKFLNKIWNAAKLVAIKGEGDYKLSLPTASSLKLSSSVWILAELERTQQEYRRRLNNYELSNALDIIYHFSWDIFCSWYLELAKVELEAASEYTVEIKAVLLAAFAEILKMLHPFMPFFTEEIWLSMDKMGQEAMLAEQKWRDFSSYNALNFSEKSRLQMVERLMDMVTVTREVRRVLEKPFGEMIKLDYTGDMEAHYPMMLAKIANAELATVESGITKPMPSGNIKVLASNEEREIFKANLEKLLGAKKQELEKLTHILTPGFKAKADPSLVAEREGQLTQVKAEVEALRADLDLN